MTAQAVQTKNDSESHADSTSATAESGENQKVDEKKSEPVEYAVGQEFQVADWTVSVASVGAPVTSVGASEFAEGAKAQGQFVPVTVNAKNNGDKAEIFFANNVKLKDSQDREYSHSTDASIWGSSQGAITMEEVNPGNTVSGQLWFDTPVDAEINSVVISGGFLDKPVTVSIK